MSLIKVFSTYPPAIYRRPDGRRVLAAGTITKVMDGNISVPIDSAIPEEMGLEWFTHARVAPKGTLKTRQVAGSKGATYTITTYPSGAMHCTCPGYTYRRTCKHL